MDYRDLIFEPDHITNISVALMLIASIGSAGAFGLTFSNGGPGEYSYPADPQYQLEPKGAHTNRRANVLRDKPCGRANAEFLFPSILAADILHRPTGGILCAPCRRALPICASASKWNADIERRKDSQYGHADCARLPHIGAAILAKKPWLRLLCPACQQQGPVDLRKVVRPADDHIAGLYDALTCTFGPCHGDGPRPAMRGLFAGRDAPLAKPASEIA